MIKRNNITAIDNSAAAAPTFTRELKNARSLVAMLKRSSHSTGNHVFKIEASIDGGTTYIAIPMLRFNANTNGQQLTRDTSITLSSDTQVLVAIEPEFLGAITHIKITATRTTDGNATVVLAIEDESDPV